MRKKRKGIVNYLMLLVEAPNQALHLTLISLRFTRANELRRYTSGEK
jgi:uncharacterized DUF497 family protein